MENEMNTGSAMNQQTSQEKEMKNSQVVNKQVISTANSRKPGFFKRHHTSVKLVVIILISLVFLIPQIIIQNLIDERNLTMEEASSDIKEKSGGPNEVNGPCIKLTEIDSSENETPNEDETSEYCYILPESLEITGNLDASFLHRGIFEYPVYEVPLVISGEFVLPKEFESKKDKHWNFEKAYVQLEVSTLRNVRDNVVVSLDGQKVSMQPNNSGVLGCEVDLLRLLDGDTVKFSIELPLKGTESLMFTPLGRTTTVNLTSNYATPSFNGNYLPDEREVTKNGFSASWKVLSINRDYPQVYTKSTSSKSTNHIDVEEVRKALEIYNSSFGVELIVPVEQYQQTTRAIKYSMLIILLTFATVFFFETRKAKPIHPVQYLLIGAALIVFYTLLLSFSEHISFCLSYLISSVMTVGLIVAFVATIMKDFKTTLGLGALLVLLYAFIYVLLQLESYALLVGSIGVFVIIGAAMFGSRKIDWYKKRD
ncbi:MAG: cell envelope integrity protein CreD [Bacteroidales bacterium]|nr:cell envelope integrity protein CreD [Bacteroidales bacterium]